MFSRFHISPPTIFSELLITFYAKSAMAPNCALFLQSHRTQWAAAALWMCPSKRGVLMDSNLYKGTFHGSSLYTQSTEGGAFVFTLLWPLLSFLNSTAFLYEYQSYYSLPQQNFRTFVRIIYWIKSLGQLQSQVCFRSRLYENAAFIWS